MALLFAGTSPVALAQSGPSNVGAYLTLANDYRSRGLSQLETGVSWRLGVDYEHTSGFFVGGLVANVEYATDVSRRRPRDAVVDYYAGYSWGKRSWTFNFAAGRYVYPDIDVDYDYTELSFGATFRNRVFYNASYASDFYAFPYSAWHHELGFAQPLRGDFEFSAAIGQFSLDVVPGADYTHWNAGVSKVLRRMGLDLRFYESSLDRISPLGNPDGDRWVLSVSYGFLPRG